jgi:hypothetical protein
MASAQLTKGQVYVHKLGFRALCITVPGGWTRAYEFRVENGNVMRIHETDLADELQLPEGQ